MDPTKEAGKGIDMAETTAGVRTGKRHSWIRRIGWILAILLVLLIVLYFVATSGPFVTGVILPRAGQALNARITASDASISPFHEVTFKNLELKTTGPQPLLAAREVHASYSLIDIIRGNIKVSEVRVVSPRIHVVYNADNTSNLDPLLKSSEEKPAEKPSEPSAPSQPPRLNIGHVSLQDALIEVVQHRPDGGATRAVVTNADLTIDNIGNGQTGKIQLSASLALNKTPVAPATTNDVLGAQLRSQFSFALSKDLKPDNLQGTARLSVNRAEGTMADLAGLSANLDTKVTPTEIEQCALNLDRDGQRLSQILLHGPFDLSKPEAHLTLAILSVDRSALNLAGAPFGLDFGPTTINSTNTLDLTKQGALLAAKGQFQISKFSVTRQNQTTPPLDLLLAYDVTVNTNQQSALVQNFTLTGRQQDQPVLLTELVRPMTIAWGQPSNAVEESALKLVVTNLNLADWRAFTGTNLVAGKANATVNLLSQKAGQELVIDLNSSLQNLELRLGSNEIQQAGVNLGGHVQVQDLKQVTLDNLQARVTHGAKPLLQLAGSGQYNLTNQQANLHTTLDAALPNLFALLDLPDLQASSGSLRFDGDIRQTTEPAKASTNVVQQIQGKLALVDFTGRQGSYRLTNFAAALDSDLIKSNDLVLIRQCEGTVSQAKQPGGRLAVSGEYRLDTTNGAINVQLADFNENSLRPFLQPSLGEKQLVSIKLNGAMQARYNPGAETSLNGKLELANLVVKDPTGQFPESPLAGAMLIDTSLNKNILDLQKAQLSLTPTDRAKNELALSGKIDMTDTNAFQGSLHLTSDGIDLTAYYDLFSGKKESAPAEKKSAPASPEKPSPGETAPAEPAPVHLPFRNFVFDFKIDRLFLRQIAITNWSGKLVLNDGQVALNPFALELNGAPVSFQADLNLGVPGYKYDISLAGDRIPIQPLADSFTEKPGAYQGDLNMHAKIQGSGTTGIGLRKSLEGDLGLVFTNANIQIVSKRLRNFLTPIAALLGAPELIDHPLSWVNTQAKMGAGKIDVTAVELVSDTFQASTQGTIPIADNLMQSPLQDWPMHFFLRRSLAEKIRIASQEPATQATNAYVQLPDFIKVSGTLDEPKPKLDKLALAGTLLEKFGSKIPGLDKEAGQLIQGLGGLLNSKSSTTNQPPESGTISTNRSTNQPSLQLPFNPFDLFKKPKKEQ